jgi:glutamate-1-semialdehyde 2,1-aminomutase
VMDIYRREDIVGRLHSIGSRLAAGVREAAAAAGVADHVVVRGRSSNLVFATLDQQLKPSQEYRTLFLRELILGGVIGPSFVVSAALSESDIDRTVDVVARACTVYRKALDAPDVRPFIGGRPVKPVFRRYV